MPRGGARSNSGPPPDPSALRRERPSDRAGWTTLPAKRVGPTPDWPLADGPSRRERTLWQRLWRLPQAVAWERGRSELDVAMYVRLMVVAERSPDPKDAAEVRQWADRLGMNPASMLRLRWVVADDAVGQRRTARAAAKPVTPAGTSARDRLRALAGGQA